MDFRGSMFINEFKAGTTRKPPPKPRAPPESINGGPTATGGESGKVMLTMDKKAKAYNMKKHSADS